MGLGMLLAAASAWTQNSPQPQSASSAQPVSSGASADYSAVYCAGFVTSDYSDQTRLISGEESNAKIVFTTRDYVFISKGSNQGVRVGDRYTVVRPDKDPTAVQWFKWQDKLMKAMGRYYIDTGQLKVINVQPNVSTAEVTFACTYLQRGDIVQPFQERPAPPFKAASENDRFAPVSGKPVGMLVVGKDFSQSFGKLGTAYVNLGTNQGVKVGDYMRVFRYQGSHAELAPNFEDFQYQMYGFGSAPQKYQWNDLPREILGEGIVLNVGPNSSTVLVTASRLEMYAGDYVEVE
jgi:hypothetical protein